MFDDIVTGRVCNVTRAHNYVKRNPNLRTWRLAAAPLSELTSGSGGHIASHRA